MTTTISNIEFLGKIREAANSSLSQWGRIIPTILSISTKEMMTGARLKEPSIRLWVFPDAGGALDIRAKSQKIWQESGSLGLAVLVEHESVDGFGPLMGIDTTSEEYAEWERVYGSAGHSAAAIVTGGNSSSIIYHAPIVDGEAKDFRPIIRIVSPMNNFVEICHNTARKKGWHDEPRSVGDYVALFHSEVSEILEESRAGHTPDEIYMDGKKPCGIPIEIADTIIRLFDFCGEHSIDIDEAMKMKMAYNETRPYRHGKKW